MVRCQDGGAPPLDAEGDADDDTDVRTRCPLTLEPMTQPVLCSVDGRVYERAAIEAWILESGTSPFSREPIGLCQLRPLHNAATSSDDDNDDDASVTSAAGWPRPRTATGSLPSGVCGRAASGGGGGGSGGCGGGGSGEPSRGSYLAALLTGGGGLAGAGAQGLSSDLSGDGNRLAWRRKGAHAVAGHLQRHLLARAAAQRGQDEAAEQAARGRVPLIPSAFGQRRPAQKRGHEGGGRGGFGFDGTDEDEDEDAQDQAYLDWEFRKGRRGRSARGLGGRLRVVSGARGDGGSGTRGGGGLRIVGGRLAPVPPAPLLTLRRIEEALDYDDDEWGG